ncbi:MAG TPA: hypothetical protein PKC82_11225 [Chitinophagaceae bacterium]|nr:hypothetical protein [Chitinophagaceae bacterium]HMW67491.1 hypothetical protein [Chitinophagaceae bacterium]HMX78549.1 hypothetical protein [Chitinophagaceae bacterium]HNA19559.1 hypothetical protein [Chitinophagaceae bacterium]HNA91008.1 hypothetical protein [Chitinophagaceae bacterium]
MGRRIIFFQIIIIITSANVAAGTNTDYDFNQQKELPEMKMIRIKV